MQDDGFLGIQGQRLKRVVIDLEELHLWWEFLDLLCQRMCRTRYNRFEGFDVVLYDDGNLLGTYLSGLNCNGSVDRRLINEFG